MIDVGDARSQRKRNNCSKLSAETCTLPTFGFLLFLRDKAHTVAEGWFNASPSVSDHPRISTPEASKRKTVRTEEVTASSIRFSEGLQRFSSN